MESKSQIHKLIRLVVFLVMVCSLLPPLAATALLPDQVEEHGNVGCSDKCGNVSIPYPFGMTDKCYLNDDFLITCNTSFTPPQPFLGTSNINVTEISLDGELHILKYRGRECFDGKDINFEPKLRLTKFAINDTLNKFVVVGCDSYGYLEGERFTTGCISKCNSLADVDDGSCDGMGCCKTSIPKNMLRANVTLDSFNDHENVSDFSPCTYAFLVEEEKFNFSRENLTNLQSVEKLPVVLAWTIGEETCEEAKRNTRNYACKGNSTCYNVPKGYSGYRCSCLEGYNGNPYLGDGCQDINECEDESRNNCRFKDKKYCKNTLGNYTCSCPKGYNGEGRGNYGCKKNLNLKIAYIVIGVSAAVVVLFAIISWLYLKQKSQRFIEMRDRFYQDNGGLALEQILSRQGNNTLNIYKEKEIIEATDNFNESNKLGEGGFGTVYKGILRNVLVAIKKSKMSDSSEMNHHNQIELFINELAVLSRINHINVVKLQGCCLETEIPMLVYEFIGNKTLSYHLHNGSSLPWHTRLTIATEAADVLSYLHTKASPPILHRDIKTENILLDESFTAKVADFGASTLIPLDQSLGHTLLVQATRGYLDPEFLQSGQLTDKSDVYSFGVVLAELLTGKRATFKDGAMQPRTLASYFLSEIVERRWDEIFDSSILSEQHLEQLQEVANLVQSCLSMDGEHRPAMKNVFLELEKIKNKVSTAQSETNSAEAPQSVGNQLVRANQSDIEMAQTQSWSVKISDFRQRPT